jgi:hypothetical protein
MLFLAQAARTQHSARRVWCAVECGLSAHVTGACKARKQGWPDPYVCLYMVFVWVIYVWVIYVWVIYGVCVRGSM